MTVPVHNDQEGEISDLNHREDAQKKTDAEMQRESLAQGK
jgi:hypothetical protein